MGNQNSGRRPQPTALKVLRGNPGQRKLNEHEPKPPAGEVVRPADLSAGALAVWDELAPACIAMGTLTVADVRPFATLCEMQSTIQQVSKSKDGRELFSLEAQERDDPKSPMEIVIDSALKLEKELATALRPYYDLFGMTPTGRAKISVPKRDEPVSRWAGLGVAE